MKNNNITLMLLPSTLFVAAIISSVVYAQENMKDSDLPKFLAIQHAESGSVSKVNATTNFLELHDVSDVILFSDRPDRIVKTESTQEFLDRWYNVDTENNSLFLDPPNAALVIDDQEGQDAVVVEALLR